MSHVITLFHASCNIYSYKLFLLSSLFTSVSFTETAGIFIYDTTCLLDLETIEYMHEYEKLSVYVGGCEEKTASLNFTEYVPQGTSNDAEMLFSTFQR